MAILSNRVSKQHQPPQHFRSLSEIYSELGHTLFHLGRYADAAQAFRDAIRETPDQAELQLYLGQAREAQKRFDDALHAYLEAIRLAPQYTPEVLPKTHHLLTRELAKSLGEWLESAWRPALDTPDLDQETRASVYLFLGRVNLYRDNFHQALSNFQKALTNKPDEVFSLEGLGEVLWREGQADKAVGILKQAIHLADQSAYPDRRATTRFRLARVLMDLGRYREAKPIIEQGLALRQAQTVKFQILLGQCYLALGQPDQALRVAEAASVQDPNQVEAYVVRAAALYDMNQYEAAAKTAEAALKLAPTHLLAIRIRAQALIDGHLDEDMAQAIRLLQVYVRQQPTDIVRQRLLIRVLREMGRPAEELIEVLQGAIANAPDAEQPSLMLELAETYLEAKNPTNVLEILDKVVRKNPGSQSAYWWQLCGDARRQEGQLEAALQSYQHGLVLAPTDQRLLERYAEILEHLNDWLRAAEGWQRLVEAVPDDSRVQMNLAQALYRIGDLTKALDTMESALLLEIDYERKAQCYQLKAEILSALERSREEVAEAYYEAGRYQYWHNEFQAATALFERANSLNSQHLPTYWYWADALHVASYIPTAPYVDKNKINDSLEVWKNGFELGRPSTDYPDFSWAYTSRALINEQLARLHNDHRHTLWWEAIVYLNRGILLREAEAYRWAYLGRFYRFLENEVAALQATRKALEYDAENLVALEERAAILANTGNFPEAIEVIDKGLSLESNAWLSGVKALVLIYQEQYEAALELIKCRIEWGDDLWSHNLRAMCYRMLDRVSSAREDYTWIWDRRTDPAFAESDNQFTFGWAAYHLALLLGQPSLLDEAISIFSRLSKDPMQRVSGDLGVCYLTRGKPGDVTTGEKCLEEAIKQAINPRELDGLLKHTLVYLEKYLSQWPHGEQVRAVLERVTPRIKAQRDKLLGARPHSATDEIAQAEQELKKVIEASERGEATDEWAWIGAHAGLARLYIGSKRWSEAAQIYQQLLQEEFDRFPEAHLGLEKTIDGSQTEGDHHLKEGRTQEALEQFREALRFVLESFADDKTRLADLHSRIGYVHFNLGDRDNARRHFLKALELYSEGGSPEPGKDLGSACRSLLPDINRFWVLDDEWRAWAAESETERSLQSDLMAARKSLTQYLDELYQLSEQSGKSAGYLTAVTPIAIEIGQRLIPEGPDTDWTLFTTYLPAMRDRIEKELGVRVPGVRIRGNEVDMPPESYLIMLDEVPVVMGNLQTNMRYSPAAAETLQNLGIPYQALIEASHPLTGKPGCWIEPDYWDLVTTHGLILWAEPLVYMVYHLEAILRQNLADFLGIQEVENLLESWAQTERGSSLIKAALPDQTTRIRFARLLRALVRERVPITSWEEILAVVQEMRLISDDISAVIRAVRLRLKRLLPGNSQTAHRLTLPSAIEDIITRWVWHEGDKTFFALPPEETQELLSRLREVMDTTDRDLVLVTHRAELRPFVRRLVEPEFPHLMVLAQEEVLAPDGLSEAAPVEGESENKGANLHA